mmetsp:Transcript_2332/g.2649  ORF Transcript_2332/g.2649 Transcript_2332/m.2649 type:complete len:99 (+) Transcript_2332:182-478(+)
MSAITEFIESMMEDPRDRDYKERKRIAEARERSLKLKEQWDEPTKSAGFWSNNKNTALFKDNMKVGGQDGKQTRYMATPTSRANSYESVLQMYSKYEK